MTAAPCAGQAVLGCLLSGLAAILLPPSWPQAAMAAPTFFLMGCACLRPTVTLWRAATAAHACHTPGRVGGHLVRRLAHRFRASASTGSHTGVGGSLRQS